MIINANANSFTHLSCSKREDTTFEDIGHKSQINVALGNLVHLHYPGEVTWSDDTRSPATCWANYSLSSDATYGTAQGVVWSNFWVSFLVIPFQCFIPDA
jgi:hypothetical protein